MDENLVGQVRPTSTFESFEATLPEQEEVIAGLIRLADSILAIGDRVLSDPYPFDNARLISLWGKPGRGKTHLIEAFINYIGQREPDLLRRIYLFREDFTLRNIASLSKFGDLPILILDDLFAKYQSVERLHPVTDIRIMMDFIQDMYERRRLVIVTSNFPFMDGIVEGIRAVDKVGRALSRLQELMATSGEIEIVGKDYREVLAERTASGDIFRV